MVGAVDERAVLRDTEAWFLRRGIPHFIDDYRAREDVFTRALPALTLLVLFEVLGAANFTWPWWQNVIAVVGGFALLIVVWMAANRMRHRPALQRPDSLGPVELAFFVLVPAILPLLFGGQYGSAAVTAAANLVLVLAIYLVTSYGLVSLTRWALGRTLRQVGAVTGLIARALPMLLLFTTLLFLTTEVWQVAASVSGVRFALTMLVFLLAGVLFLTARLPVELGRLSQDLDRDAVVSACRASPLADVIDTAGPELIDARAPELSRRQKGNVLLVLLFSQGVQVVLVTLVMGVVLFGFGLLAIRPTVVASWLNGAAPLHVVARFGLFGEQFVVTSALLHVVVFVAVFSGFTFTVYVITDTTYREQFFDEIVGEVRQSLAVRTAYLALMRRVEGGTAPPDEVPGR